MKKSLVNKFTLKILSLLIAILIWFMVMNIQDPVRTTIFHDIPVTFANESYVESMNQVAQMVEGRDTVNVEITGKSSVVGKVSKENITAIADLTQIINMDSKPIMVPVTLDCEGISSDTISASPQNIPITIEERQSADFIVAVNTGETKPDKNYEIGKMTANPETVSITGPASVMTRIDKVVAQVDVSGMDKSETRQSRLKIYDKNQDELTEKQMSYLKFNNANITADVQVELWRILKDISIEPQYTGTPKYGYQVSDIKSTPDKISIAGTEEALAAFTQNGNQLTIPEELIDVSGKAEDFDTKVDMAKLLPENIKLATDVNDTAVVTVKILPFNSDEFSIPVTSVTVTNKPSGMDVVYEKDKITVRVKGKQEDLETLTPSQIGLAIDLKSYSEGEYEVPVTVQVPLGYETVDTVKVKLKLVKAAEVTASKAVIPPN